MTESYGAFDHLEEKALTPIKEYRWTISDPPDPSLVKKLSDELSIAPSLSTILVNRGIDDFEKARRYFRPSESEFHDPFLMDGMYLAVERILSARAKNERILVYGDYDVDGTNGAGMLYLFFKELGCDVGYYIPDRIKEGYGISRAGIDHAKERSTTLLVSIDCGITAVDQVEYARSLGIDVIITVRQRLGRALYVAAPDEFPMENFYKFYWSGELTLSARKKAAQELFYLLKDHKGPCTVIAHSHGCNVALHLAECTDSKNAPSTIPPVTIERLILLAPPVQDTTAHLVHASTFKRVYSCYSIADVIQVADPQGINKEMRKGKDKLPLFSKRTYAPGPRLTQAQITFGEHSPSHRDFILPHLFGQLPPILKLLDTPQARNSEHVIIEVSFQGHVPHLIEKKQERRIMKAHSTKQRRKQ